MLNYFKREFYKLLNLTYQLNYRLRFALVSDEFSFKNLISFL
jgi:hypothetical protein